MNGSNLKSDVRINQPFICCCNKLELDGVVVVALNYSSMEQSMMKAAVKRAPDYVDDERLTNQLLAPVQDNAMSS